MTIKAIIFDFGRVISAQKPMSLFRGYEKELGIAPGTLNPIMFGSPAWEDTLVGRKTSEEFWHAIAPQLNLHTPEAVDAFRQRYHADEEINAGVADLIRKLRSDGRYKLAVLSNAPAGLIRWLDEWGLLELFDTVFCSGDEGVKKPDPAAFEITLERLGVEPEKAVFIDDTMKHIKAARALGIHGILFTTTEALVTDLDTLLTRF
jgi:putative hydrolase of the HAD superfamily